MNVLRAFLLFISTSSVSLVFACSTPENGTRNVASGGSAIGNAGSGGASGGAVGSSSGGVDVIVTFGGNVGTPDCSVPNPPDGCDTTAAPGCGDGHINQAAEECDDGNSVPGDGCSGVCKVEPFHTCPPEGGPCTSDIVCGDGMLGPGEACDDRNTMSGDGCSAKCNLVEAGFSCRKAGEPCTRVYLCGDGTPDPNEGCDDQNKIDGDGCDSKCRIETGFKCDGAPSVCSPTKCGDGKREGAESCDDGNLVPFDGCSETCQAEPTCPMTGDCSSSCGDGIILGANEECDDGNLRDGDGCSSMCKVEVDSGFTCTASTSCTMVNDACVLDVPIVYRDFNFNNSPGGHPDFNPGKNSGLSVITGLVQPTWDKDKKPALTTGMATCVDTNTPPRSTPCPTSQAFIKSAASFAQWYRDDAPSSGPIPSVLRLWDNGSGGFVNRFGPNGEQWMGFPSRANGGADAMVCSNEQTADCTVADCYYPPTGSICLDDCVAFGNDARPCFAEPTYYDGSPLFFPIDPPTPKILQDKRMTAGLDKQYGYASYPDEDVIGPGLGLMPSGVACDDKANSNWCHNFSFTSEVKYWFKYDATSTARLDFTGDDDVWVFVNGKLAVDLGGWHEPLDGSVTIDATSAAKFGLADGQVYEIGVFQAEREVKGSSFRLTLSGFQTAPSDCTTVCGDGKIAPGEQCDDGTDQNTGEYDHCSATCTLGPRCGDGTPQTEQGEECDLGADHNDGSYNGCAPNCKAGPHCGDAVVQIQAEQCDDGTNDGTYGTCNPDCTLAPHCGDEIVQMDQGEECDDGNGMSGDGCNTACKLEMVR